MAQGSQHYPDKWTPLTRIRSETIGATWPIKGPEAPDPAVAGALYVARLVRNADAALIGKTVYVMLVPWDWLSRVDSARAPTTATYHGPADKVCLTALDAPLKFNPAAVVTWCLAHLAGTPDVGSMAGRRLTGYDQERDRLVDSELAWTGYRGSVMGFDKFGLGGVGMANLWMDATSYDFLVQKMSGAPATAAVREGEQALAVAVARVAPQRHLRGP